MKTLFTIPASFAAALSLASFGVMADDFPEKDIRLIMPYGPGGATDVIFRLVTQEAEKHLPVSIVPVNMPGAGATRGSREVKDSTPDGYTLLGSHDTIVTSYLSGMADYSYDAFEPVALLTQTANIPATYADHSVKSAEDIATYIEENAGNVRIGMIPSSTDHFFWIQFFQAAGIDSDNVRLIGYPDTGSQVSALLAKEIDFSMLDMPSGHSFFESGEFLALGVAYDERLPALPDTPTLVEVGIDFVDTTSRGVFAPKGTPENHVQIISDAYKAALAEDSVISRIEGEFGSTANHIPPESYKDYLMENEARLSEAAQNIDF